MIRLGVVNTEKMCIWVVLLDSRRASFMYHYVARSRQSLIVRRRVRHCNLDIDVFHASQRVNNFSRSTAIYLPPQQFGY